MNFHGKKRHACCTPEPAQSSHPPIQIITPSSLAFPLPNTARARANSMNAEQRNQEGLASEGFAEAVPDAGGGGRGARLAEAALRGSGGGDVVNVTGAAAADVADVAGGDVAVLLGAAHLFVEGLKGRFAARGAERKALPAPPRPP